MGVVNCALMFARGKARPHAVLWDFDWQTAGMELEPTDDFAASLLKLGARLASGAELGETVSKALWSEMNRLPHLWSMQGDAENVCTRLPGLEKMRRCVRALATLAAP